MTNSEFDHWSEFYFTAFPDSARWLNALANPAGTLKTWLITLSRCEAADVMAVTEKIIRGELAPIENYQRDNTALHVRAYAAKLADERRRAERNDRERRQVDEKRGANRRNPGHSAGGMFKAIIKFREEGQELGFEGKNLNQFAHDKLEEWLRENEPMVGQTQEAF
jgi:hypothetical protein